MSVFASLMIVIGLLSVGVTGFYIGRLVERAKQ